MGYGGLSQYKGPGIKVNWINKITSYMWSFVKRAEGWELSFLFFFKRAFFNGWGGEEGGDAPSIPKGFFFLPLWGMERGFFSSAGPFQWGVVSWLTWERGEVWLFLNVRVEFSLFFLLLPRSCSWEGCGGVFSFFPLLFLFRGTFSKNILCTNQCLYFFGTKHGKISPWKSPNFE